MRNIYILIILLTSIELQAQERIGKPIDSLLTEFSNPDYHTEKIIDGKYVTIRIQTRLYMVDYVAENSDTCTHTVIYPRNEQAKIDLSHQYNKDLYVRSKVEWYTKNTSNPHKYYIVKLFEDDGPMLYCRFVWSIHDDRKEPIVF